MNKNKKKKLTTSLAVALAALLLIGGGTFAYLQSNTEDVVNTFNANQVTVKLIETTGGDYDIIPGTTQEKDPKVTVNNSIDAYVYVEVTDTTDGLVTYSIAEGWTLLDGYDDVYYREVEASDTAQELYVLTDNQVSYSADLENDDMLDGDTLKKNLNLTFKAYAIQKDGFANAVAAWNQVPAEVSTTEEINEAIQEGKPVVLANDVSVGAARLNNAGGADIDLNDNTITINGTTPLNVDEGKTLSIKNGEIKFGRSMNTNIQASEESIVSFENVEMDMNNRTILVPDGINSAQVNIIDSQINTTNNYVISTNANNRETGKGVVINVINSTLTADDPNGDCTAILMNVPGTLTIDNSNITAGRQAVIVRTGTATITDSTLTSTLEAAESLWAKYDDIGWGSGNEVPVAVLVVGDRSAAYPWDAECTLNNVTLSFSKETDRKPIYAAAYDGQKTVLNGVSADQVTVSTDADGVTIK